MSYGEGAGFQLVQAMKGVMDVPIVVMTRRSSKEDISQALEKGADDYLQKPLDEISLAEVIKRNSTLINQSSSLMLKELKRKDISNINVSASFKLVKVSEKGLTIQSSVYCQPQTYLELSGEILEEVIGETCKRFTVLSSRKNSDDLYDTFLSIEDDFKLVNMARAFCFRKLKEQE